MAINQAGILPQRQFLASRGQYFRAQNPTTGTGVALNAAVTSFSATNGFLVLNNTSPTLSVYLDRLKLILTAATTAVVSVDFLVVLDTVTRNPSTAANGTAIVPTNPNSGSNTTSALAIQAFNNAGAMTIPAAGALARTAARAHVPTGLHVVGDSIEVQFGDAVAPGTGGLTGSTRTSASAPGAFVVEAEPVIIGPQGWAVIHRWSLSEAGAPSYEWTLGWTEG
jgi:hypothetical protein